MATAVEKDPWLDEEFGTVDFTEYPEDVPLPNLPMLPADIDPASELPPEPTPPVAPPEPPAPEPDQDDSLEIDLGDGAFATMEKSSKGWKGTVDIGSGSTQVYYGKTKNELIGNLFKAQAHSTKKIREQNRTIKLGVTTEQVQETVREAQRAVGKKLNAEEVFEIKTLLESDPDKALESWFQKRTGRTLEDLVQGAERGEAASRELLMEQTNKQFLSSCKDYYPDPDYENFNSLLSYLAKHKLRRGRKPGDEQEILDLLVNKGLYTASNLETAFTELTEDGLLLPKPRAVRTPEPQPTATPTAAQTPAAERIVRTETRPRAGYGIRTTEVTPTRTTETTPLPAEDYERLTDAELDARIAEERRKVLSSRR